MQLVLLCAAIGVILGLVSFSTFWDYITLGFWKNAFFEIRNQTTRLEVMGIVFAVYFIIFGLLWEWVWPGVKRVLRISSSGDTLIHRSGRAWLYLICLTFGMLLLGIRHTFYGQISLRRMWVIVISLFFWCWLFAIYREFLQRSKHFTWFHSKTLAIGFYGTSVVLVPATIFSKTSALPWKAYIPRFETLAVLLVLVALVIFVLIRYYLPKIATYSTESHFPKQAGVAALIVSIILLIFSLLPVSLWAISPYVLRCGTQPAPYNVILIGIDTLRADHSSLLGPDVNKRQFTPNLSQLAKRGTVFQSAISQSPWTMPAFASILTGKYPHEHGAISLYGFLRREELTLAEIMREAGYFTGAIVSHFYVDAGHGFAQGFNYFNEDYSLGHDAITSEGVTNCAINFLKKHGNERFFLFLHYFDPHCKYQNHQDWNFADAYSGWLRAEPYTFDSLRKKRHLLGLSEIKYLTDLYDEEIAYTDKHIGRLLRFVEEQGLMQNTVFVVVGDHGEEFMEHGWIGHTISLYDELIRVPLLIVLPGFEHNKHIVSNVIETRSVFSTLIDYLGLPCALENPPPSLLPMIQTTAIKNNSGASPNSAYSTVWLPDADVESGKRVEIFALRTDRWKLIIDHTRKKEFLFDLKNDPQETGNLVLQNQKVFQEMRQKLRAWYLEMVKETVDVPTLELNEEQINKLKSLGYL